MHCQGIQLRRQCKDQVEVFDREQVVLSLLYPFFPLLSLALRTMPVSAAIVADAHCATGSTPIYMTSHGSSSAPHEGT